MWFRFAATTRPCRTVKVLKDVRRAIVASADYSQRTADFLHGTPVEASTTADEQAGAA